jgi:hypothetical protein
MEPSTLPLLSKDDLHKAINICLKLERSNRALKARLKNTKAVIQTRQEEISQQRQQIDRLCAAEISKKEMHKIICDQAQALSDLLGERRESEKA